MSKFLRRYVRKVHRWLAVPTAILIPVFFVLRLTPAGQATVGIVNRVQMVQQVLMLSLALTGAYLLLLPYWTKWRRRRAKQ